VSDNPYRLPRTVAPTHYRLRLEPDLTNAEFSGSETIDITVETEAEEIVLNAAEIEITSAQVTNGTETIGASARYDEEMQRAILALESPVAPGDWELKIDFKGILNDQLRGFYRSRFTDVDGNEQYIATTQFESTDARRAFPCWDEPDFKATFQTTLVLPADLMAITNTAEQSREELPDGRVAVRFAETMKMSTYLVAFVVGPFEATEALDVDGVPTRIVVPRGKLELADYALECAEFCFRYLRDYYGIPYPGDKLDHIAIPDFAFGAMENVGAITYRETALLIDPERASQAEKLRILDVIGHEIAHQWFGNLVTMKWWEGIWLNEAFASFMEMKATDARRPEWKRWLTFGAVERPWAMEVDHLSTTRPVEFEVTSPEEADQMFDALTYGKGSSILRMIEQFIGEESFRNGVGAYLRRHAYGNTVTADLWAGLDGASEWPVGSIMDTWILQGGYPQIDVRAGDGKLHFEQRRYLAIPDETDQTLWKVPLQVRGSANGEPFQMSILLEEETGSADAPAGLEWVTANAGGSGFYRVRYSPELHEALVANLVALEPTERYSFLYDMFSFAQVGQLEMATVLELISAYTGEKEQAIWQLIFRILGVVYHHMVSDEDLDAFASWVRSVVEPLVDDLGRQASDSDSDLTRRLRGQAVAILGALGNDPETIEWAATTTEEYLDGKDVGDPELATAALSVTAAHGDADTHSRFLKRYMDASNPQEQLRFLRALSGFDDADMAAEVVAATLDGRIRNQDGAAVQSWLMGNRDSGADTWTLVRRQWTDCVSTFPPMTFRRLVEGLPALSRPEVAADVKAFFAETPVPSASKAVAQNLELLEVNVAARSRESSRVSEWLRQRG
jgi:puromycin-sensitive aminopeptidase